MIGLLAERDIVCLTAPNPGPFTLSGTNTWVVGRDPAWIVDPGPEIEEHVRRLYEAIDARGGLGGTVLTHGHADHSQAVPAMRERYPAAPLAGAHIEPSGEVDGEAGGELDIALSDGRRVGPFLAVAAPGHSPDSFALIARRACFSGDAVLGQGSVYIAPYPGAMASYMRALQRLSACARGGNFDVICPGHGPLVVDAQDKLSSYLAHRREREQALVAAFERGLRSERELLDSVWADVPEQLRPLAAVSLAAHLDKLADDGLLPAGVERPSFEGVEW